MTEHQLWKESYRHLPLGAGEDEISAASTEKLEQAHELMRTCQARPPVFGLLRLPEYCLGQEALTLETLRNLINESAVDSQDAQGLGNQLRLEELRTLNDLHQRVEKVASIIYNEMMRYPRVCRELAGRMWREHPDRAQKLLEEARLPLLPPAGVFEPPGGQRDFPPCPLASLDRFVTYVREHGLAEYELDQLGNFVNAALEWHRLNEAVYELGYQPEDTQAIVRASAMLSGRLSHDKARQLPLQELIAPAIEFLFSFLASLEAADRYYNGLALWNLGLQARLVGILADRGRPETGPEHLEDLYLSGEAMDDLCSETYQLMTGYGRFNFSLLTGVLGALVEREWSKVTGSLPDERLAVSRYFARNKEVLRRVLGSAWEGLHEDSRNELALAYTLEEILEPSLNLWRPIALPLFTSLERELLLTHRRLTNALGGDIDFDRPGLSEVLERAITDFSKTRYRDLVKQLAHYRPRLVNIRNRTPHADPAPPTRGEVLWLKHVLIGEGLIRRLVEVRQSLSSSQKPPGDDAGEGGEGGKRPS